MKRISAMYIGIIFLGLWLFLMVSPPYAKHTQHINKLTQQEIAANQSALNGQAVPQGEKVDTENERNIPKDNGGDQANVNGQENGKPDVLRFKELWTKLNLPDYPELGNISRVIQMPSMYTEIKDILADSTVKTSNPADRDELRYLHSSLQQRLSGAIIIGCKKCGSTFLKSTLALHPYVAMTNREVHYFNKHTEHAMGPEHYKTVLAASFQDQITMEKSPSYFLNKDTPQRVYDLNPKMKLILVLREPACRSISDYFHGVRYNSIIVKSNETIEDIFATDVRKYLDEYSLYHKAMQLWVKVFPMSSFLLVRNEDMTKLEPLQNVLLEVEDFLEVPRSFKVVESDHGVICVSGGEGLDQDCFKADGEDCKYSKLYPELMQRLKEDYAQETKMFQELVGRDFHW